MCYWNKWVGKNPYIDNVMSRFCENFFAIHYTENVLPPFYLKAESCTITWFQLLPLDHAIPG